MEKFFVTKVGSYNTRYVTEVKKDAIAYYSGNTKKTDYKIRLTFNDGRFYTSEFNTKKERDICYDRILIFLSDSNQILFDMPN